MPALIDRFLPRPDAAERHAIAVGAAPERVYRAVLEHDFARSLVLRSLMGLRATPGVLLELLAGRRPRLSGSRRPLTLGSLEGVGFGRLAETPGRELVLGVSGRFWRPAGNVAPFDRRAFDRPVAPGLARAVWNFTVDETANGALLATETRVLCGDPASRRKFRAYWLLIRPFSGWIRRVMLRRIRATCEGR